MTDAATREATYADLEAVPPHLVAEIIHGALVTHPRPVPRHAIASSALGAEIVNAFQFGRGGPGGWIFMVEPELHIRRNVVVPDIAGWRRERLPALPDTAYIETAPDWVCEVLSPSTEFYDRGAKRDIYAQAGVSWLWFLHPASGQLEAFQCVAANWLLLGTFSGPDEVRIPPFDAIPFSLGLLWPFDVPTDKSPPQT